MQAMKQSSFEALDEATSSIREIQTAFLYIDCLKFRDYLRKMQQGNNAVSIRFSFFFGTSQV